LNKAGMDIQKSFFVTSGKSDASVMRWAERCQTSCKQRNRAFGKPDIAINPASL
jgi:hypothetical protein